MISGSSFIVTNFDSYRRLTWLLTSPVKIIRGTRKLVQTPGINKKKTNLWILAISKFNPTIHYHIYQMKSVKIWNSNIKKSVAISVVERN